MKLNLHGCSVLIASLLLSSCAMDGTSNQPSQLAGQDPNMPAPLASNTPLAGGITNTMDQNDKDKLSKALDAGLGKSTSWTNPINNIVYTVTPTQKMNIPGGKFCRAYNVKSEHGGQTHEVQGTACVGENGTWQVVG